jgi:hypothetical protein
MKTPQLPLITCHGSLIIFFFLISCSPCKYVARHPSCFPPDTIIITNTKTIHDSITYIQPDSASLIAAFYCDSANQVLMRTISEYKSKGIVTKVVFKDNRLAINMYTDSIAVLNRIISNIKSKTITLVNPVNTELQRKNARLTTSIHHHRWLWYYFFGSILITIVFIYLKLK